MLTWNHDRQFSPLRRAVETVLHTGGGVVALTCTGYEVWMSASPENQEYVVWRPTAEDLHTRGWTEEDWWYVPRQITEDILAKEG